MRHLIPNSTQIPDVILDLWMGKLSGAEFKVVLYIARRTYGFGRTGDTISLKQISAGLVTRDGRRLDHGTGLNKDTVVNALARLEKIGAILREQRRHEEYGDLANFYQLNLDCEDWWSDDSDDSPVSENPTGGGKKSPTPRVGKSDTPVSDFNTTRVGNSDTIIRETVLRETVDRETAATVSEKLPSKTRAQRTPKPSAAALDFEERETTPETLALTEELVGAGLNRTDANRLAEANPSECKKQLEYLPYKTDLENPGAYLRRAIEGSFGPPREFTEAQKREEAEQQKRTQAEAQAAKKAQAEEAARQAVAALDAEIQSLKGADPEAFQAFEAYIEAERTRIVSRFPSERIRETMSRDFAKPEKRRELYRQWAQSRMPPEASRMPVEPRKGARAASPV